MNNLQVEYFKAVAHFKNFTQAAAELHVSQPAVSKQISAMEEEFGVTLFTRKGRVAELTLSGQVFLEAFVKIGDDMENAIRLAKELDGKQANRALRANMTFFIDWDSDIFVLPLISHFRDAKPSVDLEMENRGLSDISASLGNAHNDITVVFDYLVPDAYRDHLDSAYLTDVNSMLYFSAYHPFAKKEALRFSDFADDECVMCYYPIEQQYITNLCGEYGFRPRFKFVQNHDSMLMTVQGGRGFCVLDEWSRNRRNITFRTIPLEHGKPVCAYWRKNNRNPAIPLVIDALRDIAKNSHPVHGTLGSLSKLPAGY